jgi:iron complex transport system substrate-binding protein
MKNYVILLLAGFFILAAYLAAVFLTDNKTNDHGISCQTPERVISINPAATEIIFELGCSEKLIAVSNFCDYPPETKNLPKVGGVINPNLEQIAVLQPDLIIIQGKSKKIAEYCKHRKIEHITINLRNIEEIYQGINKIGDKLLCREAADKLCEKIRTELKNIESRLANYPQKKVFFSLYRTPGSLTGITTIGPKTLLSELLNIAGGQNIFNDLNKDYPIVSKETLIKRQPEIIIEHIAESSARNNDINNALNDWEKLGKLKAVRNDNLYIAKGDLLLKPGPRVDQAALKLAKIIHPEMFDE